MSKPLSVASLVPSSISNPCLCYPSPPHLLHFIPPALGEFSHPVPLLTVFPWPRTWSDIPPMMLPACLWKYSYSLSLSLGHCLPKVSPDFPTVYPLLSTQTILQSQDVTDLCASNRLPSSLLPDHETLEGQDSILLVTMSIRQCSSKEGLSKSLLN